MMRGGIGIIAAAWKFVVPLLFIVGAYMLLKKAFAGGIELPKGPAQDSQRVKTPDPVSAHNNNAVIEICPHCLSEVGSCPKCKKKKAFF